MNRAKRSGKREGGRRHQLQYERKRRGKERKVRKKRKENSEEKRKS